jgi:hypothetical protein
MGLELGGMGLWTYPAEPPEEPYAYILDDERIIRAISNLAGLLIIPPTTGYRRLEILYLRKVVSLYPGL